MPLHDWTRVPSGLFHNFHQGWSIRIKDALNAGVLPKGLAALVEQRIGKREPDVLPVTSGVRRTDRLSYASRANRIVVRHHLARIVAVIEIVSPGNKDSRSALRSFVQEFADLLREGIHLLIVDVFPPSPRDPSGMHKAIWDEIIEQDFAFPPGKSRILASYQAGRECTAYVEPVTVGDELPEMPIFLSDRLHVMVPLEPTYQATWDAQPEELRLAVETGVLPEVE